MAHFAEVHLKDAESEAFLISRGLRCYPHCGWASLWTNLHCRVHFKVDEIIRDDETLQKRITEQSFDAGKLEGKKEAIGAINRMIFETVFPKIEDAVPDTGVSFGLYGEGRY